MPLVMLWATSLYFLDDLQPKLMKTLFRLQAIKAKLRLKDLSTDFPVTVFGEH